MQPYKHDVSETRNQKETRMRPIEITPALNGYIVRCGCQTVVFDDRKKMLSELESYLNDPCGVERRFMEQAVNRPKCDGAAGAPIIHRTVEQPEPARPGAYQPLHQDRR